MKQKTWDKVTGPDVSAFILKRMDEIEDLATPEDAGRKGEQKGHMDELLILSDYLRRLNEDRQVDKPVTYFFLTVQNAVKFPEAPLSEARVVVQYDEFGKLQTLELKTHQQWLIFIAERKHEAALQGLEIIVMASSSMDFPHDYTEELRVVDLARSIRSNRVTV